MQFKEYPSYKNSFYFRTDLPRNWMEKKLQYISSNSKNSFVDGPFGSDLKTDDYKDSGIPLIQLNNIRDGKHFSTKLKFITESKKNELSRHIALPNDVVIAKMADPVARAAIVNSNFSEYVIVADCVKLTPNNKLVDINYLVWAINSSYVRNNAEIVSNGTTRIRINLGELKKLKIPYPSLSEQTQIANFLDQETTKIDNLIAKQEKLIELLEEQRKSIISHAVTKGLNPNAPMKDSGVEWLGEVPEHWNLKPIKFLAKTNQLTLAENTDENFEIQYVDIGSVSRTNGIEKIETILFKDAPSRARRIVKDGDIIVSTVRTYLKAIAYIENPPKNLIVSTGFAVLNPIRTVIFPQYAKFTFLAEQFIAEVIAKSKGISYPAITATELADIKIALPPLNEQKVILQYLLEENLKMNKLISKQNQLIEKLKEYRASIISHAVTGKIDVREFGA